MKKKALALSLALLLILALAACGASAGMNQTAAVAPEGEYSNDKASGTSLTDTASYGGISPQKSGGGETQTPPIEVPEPAAPENGTTLSDKIIYSAYAEIETQDFDGALDAVSALIDRYGGFLQSSSVSGNDYASSKSTRTADFVIRIPSENFEAMTGSLSELGNVPVLTTNAENITAQYNDTQSRLDAYQIEYDRLLSMLEKAETVEDMLSIEDRLSDVRYNIESLSNTVAGWDSLISYSTVELRLTEVVKFTESPETSYWDSVGLALRSTLTALGSFFKGLLKSVIAFSPALAVAAVIAVPAAVVVRRSRKRRAAKKAPPEDGENKS